jgi:hypothetical protein
MTAQNRAFNGSSLVFTPSNVTRLAYTTKTGTFTVGESVSQATSLARGTFFLDDGTYLHVVVNYGTFDTHQVTGASSGATCTPTAASSEPALSISAGLILSVKPDLSAKGIDVSGAGEDEIIEPGQEKDTLSVEHIGPTIAGFWPKSIGSLTVTRADAGTRTMNPLVLLKISESGSKNAPWTTTLTFEEAHPLSA